MAEFFQQVVNGLSVGSVYVLVAIGVTLIFGVSKLINFAQGQFLVLGSFLAFSLVSAGLSFWVAAALGFRELARRAGARPLRAVGGVAAAGRW